jgi:coenzyme F420-reducing hydrogenase alpha subunit
MIWKRIQMIITTPWNNPVIKKKKKKRAEDTNESKTEIKIKRSKANHCF